MLCVPSVRRANILASYKSLSNIPSLTRRFKNTVDMNQLVGIGTGHFTACHGTDTDLSYGLRRLQGPFQPGCPVDVDSP